MSRDHTQTPSATALTTALHAHPGSTAAALALAAGIGRSTVTRILAAWERSGKAVRTPGGRIDERPQPDRWTAPTTIPAKDNPSIEPASCTAVATAAPPGPTQPAAMPSEA
jgi:hypothetical protein